MNLKKLGIVALTTATLLTPFAPIMAEDKSTTVTYTVNATYQWTIPSEGASMVLTTSGVTGKVALSKVNIAEKTKLQVTVKGNGADDAFTMSSGSNTMPYTVKIDGKEITKGTTILSCDSSKTEGEVSLTFSVPDNAATGYKVGEYSGKVIFTTSIVSSSN